MSKYSAKLPQFHSCNNIYFARYVIKKIQDFNKNAKTHDCHSTDSTDLTFLDEFYLLTFSLKSNKARNKGSQQTTRAECRSGEV